MSECDIHKRVLNYFREQHPETVTTDDLADEFDCTPRSAQNYVNQLQEQGRIIVEKDGKPKHWALSEFEPTEPEYDPQLMVAKRWGNIVRRLANYMVVPGIGFVGAAGVVQSNYFFAAMAGVSVPFLHVDSALFMATVFGVVGTVLVFFAGLAFLVSAAGPQYVAWKLGDTLPPDD